MRYFWLLAIVVTCGTLAQPEGVPAEYPTEPEEAVNLYETVRDTLQPGTIAPGTSPSPASHIGQALELRGDVLGRIAVNATDPALRTVLVRFSDGQGLNVCATSPSELTGLMDGETVRAIVDVPPADAAVAKFRLRAIVREFDMPLPPQVPGGVAVCDPGSVEPQAGAVAPAAPAPAGSALPPELRAGASDVPRLSAFTVGGNGVPRAGKDGMWDPVGSTFPQVEQAQLDAWIPWVTKQNSRLTYWQADWITRWVVYYSALYGVDHRLMFAMIKCESSFRPDCISHAGAVGLTQLMPCNLQDYKVLNKWNVQEQIRAGVKHFRDMLNLWEGRGNYEQFALGAASYNAGPNAVKRAGGIPNITETRNYVKKLGDLFYQLVKAGYP